MSRGYGASCRKAAEDKMTLIYEYSVYNWNQMGYSDSADLYDGMICINKSAITNNAFFRNTYKRLPNGKRIFNTEHSINYTFLLEFLFKNEDIIIENCSNAWKFTEDDIDVMAYRLVLNILVEYKKQGIFPEHVGINY